jgi:glycosyltransferase involved in cell wall biosynthesis
MNFRALLAAAYGLGWRTTLTIVSANVRLYGWSATIKKINRRINSQSNLYRNYIHVLERLNIDSVEKSSLLFGKPSILIVGALDLPQCKKYRVLQKVEYFGSRGWSCYYAHYLDEPRVISYLQIATALILYRVPSIPQMDDYLNESKRLGVKTFYDIDDPIFSEAIYSENWNLSHLEPHERTHLLNSVVLYREAMKKVDFLILSTSYLKELASREFQMPVLLWRNLADEATLSMVEDIIKVKKNVSADPIVIGYASGSRAHDEDFRVVVIALKEMLEKYDRLSLLIIGHATIPPELATHGDRIDIQPFSGYLQYLEALSNTDINIVPLLLDRFNECKSAIRYIEASLVRVPTIASPVGQFSEIILDGEDGYLAANQEEWVSKLDALILDRDFRTVMAEKSREKVLMYHTIASEGAIDPYTLEQFTSQNE